MKRKIKNLTIIPLVLLFTINSYGQTWQIGYPTAANVTATLNNGTLTISGTGATQDFIGIGSPWYRDGVDNSINTVVINGITKIGSAAFYGCGNISSVTFPNSLTDIGENSFVNCKSLISIAIGNSVKTIGSGAFNSSGLTGALNIPNSVQTIGNSAFMFTKITSVSFGNSVETIDEGAFGATPLTGALSFPSSLRTIGENAFNSCPGITSITIPSSVTSIGNMAFVCTNLTDLTVSWATPLSISNTTFYGGWLRLSTVNLHVPMGKESLYASTPVWQDFTVIGIYPPACKITANDFTVNSTAISGINQSFNLNFSNLRSGWGSESGINLTGKIGFALYDNTGSAEIGYSPNLISLNELQPGYGWSEYPVGVRLSQFGLTSMPERGTYRIYPVFSENISSPYRPYTYIKKYDYPDLYVTVTIPSDDATLSSLSVNGYSLSPSFNANETNYTVTVPNSVTTRTISATATESHATVSGTGSKSLNVGNNVFNIEVTSEAGNTKIYTVTITRKENVLLTVSPTNYNFTMSGGTSSTISIISNQSWTVSSNASWLSISQTSGSNNGTFTITAATNTSTSLLGATVTVSGGGITRTISITQDKTIIYIMKNGKVVFDSSVLDIDNVTLGEAVSGDVLVVNKNDGLPADKIPLTSIQQFSFSAENLFIETSSGSATYAFKNIAKLFLGNGNTGINNPFAQSGFDLLVYVTPAGDVTIESPVAIKSLTLFSVDGKMISKQYSNGAETKCIITLQNRVAGVYLLQVETEQGTVVKKVVKQ